jgi:hypothetical protein
MQFPLNIIHVYIGFPVLLLVSLEAFYRNNKKRNITTLYIGYATLLLALSMLSFGIPALFITDSRTLSIFTYIGDVLQAVSLLFFWFISIRAFVGTKPKLKIVAQILVITLCIAIITEAMFRNLTPPYSTAIETSANGITTIVYSDTLRYIILNGINSIAFLLLGVFFWMQGNAASTPSRKLRIRSYATGFLIAALVYIAMPAYKISETIFLRSVLLSVLFLIIAVAAVISHSLDKKEKILSSKS